MKVIVLGALCLTIVACQGEQPQPEPVVRPVRYLQVYAGGVERERVFSGVAQSSIESKLSFKVSGTLQTLAVSMGQHVEAGQLLAGLDPKDYELKVDQTSASHEQATAQQRNAAASYRRTLALYENNNASRNDLDAARAAKESADAQVRALANSLELARLQLSYTRLTAPVDGVVASVPVEVNENVQAGQTVVTLTAGQQPEVVVGVPEVVIAQIREGDPVQVRFDALAGRRFSAVVTEVAVMPSAASSTYEVRARLDETDPAIRSGMTCEVAFQFASRQREGFVVPPVAVLEDRHGRFVYVVEVGEGEYGVARRREVQVGDLLSGGLEIITGLRDGDLVITAGVSKIHDGMQVRLLPQ
jgi:RND family efflux transporter MFP subunit